MTDDIAILMRQWYISLLSENPELAAGVLAASGEIERLRAALRLVVNARTDNDDDAHVMKEVAMKALGLRHD